MLKQLDTLIGFAVVMSVVSLLITIITQMISSALGLRGKNLADALQAMVQKIDPQNDPQAAERLIHRILTHPVISDSTLSMSKQFWDRVPLLSWLRRRWKTTSAIRSDELLEILKDLAGVTPSQVRDQINTALQAAVQASATARLTATQQVVPAAVVQAQAIANEAAIRVAALRMLVALHNTTPAADAAVAALTAQTPSLANATPQQVAALAREINDANNVAQANLDKWFNSAQDRAQQWFAMHTRFWTVDRKSTR